MNVDLLSVVAPVYNVEKYLSEFLESVVNQTYNKMQIILIDDGSTDKSGLICDEYAKRDSRITVIHQKNGGAGAAKNVGLELVKGEYLSIVDSDDYLELNMYECMLRNMQKFNSDAVQCLYYNTYVNGEYPVNYNRPQHNSRVLTARQFLSEYISDWKYVMFWNKLFKTSLLKDIRFPVGRKIDDEYFTYKLVGNAKTVLNINDVLYHYRMRSSSVMNENSELRLYHDRAECFLERYDYIVKRFPDLEDIYYRHMSDSFLYFNNQANGHDEYLRDLAKRYPLRKVGLVSRVKNRLIKTGDARQNAKNEMLFYE